jgi:gamma-glutamylputrescine oxidase
MTPTCAYSIVAHIRLINMRRVTVNTRMVNQNWWITTLLIKAHRYCPPLTRDIECDVLIIGGGFSGMSAAAEFLLKGLRVVLIEKNIVGGSSSGRSAGFLTPDSELELHQLVRRYGTQAAAEIWEAPCRGIDRIVETLKRHDIQCGLLKQDSLFLGLGSGGTEAVESERECRESVGFTDQRTYDKRQLQQILGAEGYTAGIRYGGTYGINPLQCLQGLKDLLIDNGMQVFESTEMDRLEDHTAHTHAGTVTAQNIIVAVDKLTESISPLADETFHAQTFLSVTEPLTDRELRILFPAGEQMQCWDSKLVYSYFRLTRDNRLLLGGGTAITTFLKDAYNNPGVIRRVIKDFRSHFPRLDDLSFIQFWPGQIDMTRDLLPVIARPPGLEHVRFILGCVGIPWATFCGSFAARNVLGEADDDYRKYFNYFSNQRPFALPSGLGKVIGKPLLFSLANTWAKFYQVDTLRTHAEAQKEF